MPVRKHMKLISYTQLEIRKLIPALQVAIRSTQRKIIDKNEGEVRLKRIGKILTDLIKEERIEVHSHKASEAQGYAERLIAEAVKHGDKHKPTMEIADYYLQEKQTVHKLFKVLAPRFTNHEGSYTNLYLAPLYYPQGAMETAILELKGNPFPPLVMKRIPTHNWINNILLDEVRKEYKLSKTKEK